LFQPAFDVPAGVVSDVVKLADDIEPLVRLLEETPREKLLEEVAQRIRGGTSYREIVAALLLAGVKNVQPRPSVGFKFHAVLVVNSAHLASLGSPDSDRWLPIFWALDEFKNSQAKNIKERNGWRMGPVNEDRVPPPHLARQAFTLALENWDVPAADAIAFDEWKPTIRPGSWLLDVGCGNGRSTFKLGDVDVNILAFDVYPCESGPCDYATIDRAVQQIHAAHVANWEFIIQDFSSAPWRWPTPAEIQGQFDHWKGQGAIGYWIFAWDYQGQQVVGQPGNIAALRQINSQ